MEKINVVKRDGSMDPFCVEKIRKMLVWGCEGLEDVDPDRILMNSKLNIFDKIKTEDIHKVLVESASSLIDDEVNYTWVASRLAIYKLRKEVWGGKNAPKLYDHLKKGVKRGFYTKDLLDNYSKNQINKLDEFISHDRDFKFQYGGIVQMMEKYLVQDRSSGEIIETPQFAYILQAMSPSFEREAEEEGFCS